MKWANPGYFLLLGLIPIYLGLIWYNRDKLPAFQISVFQRIKKSQKKSFFLLLPSLQHILAIITLVLMVITLARPQKELIIDDVKKYGVDIILALDVSESMLAKDLEPNRIEAAKESIQKFLENRENDRLGIVVFSGKAFTQSPLTFDYQILSEYLDKISTDSINQRVTGLSGTAIGDAILSALNRFKMSEDRTKVLILVTDGDANVGVDPMLASQKAADEGVIVYAIGIGQEGGAPIPVTDALGNQAYAQNRDGSIMMATFNEAALKEIAAIGNGKYFRVDDNQEFEKVLNEIDSLQKRELAINSRTEYEDRYSPWAYALGASMFLYVLSLTIKPINEA